MGTAQEVETKRPITSRDIIRNVGGPLLSDKALSLESMMRT